MHRYGLTKARSMGPVTDMVERAGGSIERVFRRAELPLRLMSPEKQLSKMYFAARSRAGRQPRSSFPPICSKSGVPALVWRDAEQLAAGTRRVISQMNLALVHRERGFAHCFR